MFHLQHFVGMALLIKSSGETLEVTPANGKDFKLAELYYLLSCDCIDTINLADGRVMIIDDEGKLKPEYDVNLEATFLFREGRMNYHELREYMKSIEEAGINVIDARETKGEDYIAGDVLVCFDDEFL
jgi:hypothetical protein